MRGSAIIWVTFLLVSCGGGGGDSVQTSESQSPWVGLWSAIERYDPSKGQWEPVADMVEGMTTTWTLEFTNDRLTQTLTGSSFRTITVSCQTSGPYSMDSAYN